MSCVSSAGTVYAACRAWSGACPVAQQVERKRRCKQEGRGLSNLTDIRCREPREGVLSEIGRILGGATAAPEESHQAAIVPGGNPIQLDSTAMRAARRRIAPAGGRRDGRQVISTRHLLCPSDSSRAPRLWAAPTPVIDPFDEPLVTTVRIGLRASSLRARRIESITKRE